MLDFGDAFAFQLGFEILNVTENHVGIDLEKEQVMSTANLVRISRRQHDLGSFAEPLAKIPESLPPLRKNLLKAEQLVEQDDSLSFCD